MRRCGARPAGAEVFFLSLDRADEEARRVAESEGVAMPVFGGGTREIDVILWEMAQTRHLVQSAELAKALESQLRTSVPMSPRPIQQAPFRVLVGANMPAVLVELGYLTNAEQESALASAPFQTRLAQAITEAVARFLATPPPRTWRGRTRRAAMTRGARLAGRLPACCARGRPRLGAVRGAAAMDATGAPA